MLCSLSGQVPVDPVVSLKSGHIFEKRLLLKYLEQHDNHCPVTDQVLDVEHDLLNIQAPPTSVAVAPDANSEAKPSAKNLATFAPEAAGIPQLLALFQNEWDAVMLETFTLKQHLDTTRKELSHALYQYDAACRVITRLNGENENLRAKLAARTSANANGNDVEMEDDHGNATGIGLSAEAVATIEAKQKALAKQRRDFKKKQAPLRAELLRGITEWHVDSSHTIHDSDKPGILCVAIDPKQVSRVVTGGVDKNVKVFNAETQQLAATLTGHTKKISGVQFHPTADLVASASYDKTVKLWSANDSGYNCLQTLQAHEDAVTGVSVHATGDFLVSASLDASWAFSDLRSGQLISRGVVSPDAPTSGKHDDAYAALCVSFHPDGAIFATGAKTKQVQMWEVKSMSNVVSFDGHASPVTSLSFSENGYQLATASQDAVVKLWDLRKLKSFFEIDMNTALNSKFGPINHVSFDPSGTYLAVAGKSLQVLHEVSKQQWQPVKAFEDHKAAVMDAAFAPDSSFLASVSMDRSLKLFRSS